MDVSGAGSAAAGSLTLARRRGADRCDLEGQRGTGAAGGSFALDAVLSAPSANRRECVTPIAAALVGGGFNQAIGRPRAPGDLGWTPAAHSGELRHLDGRHGQCRIAVTFADSAVAGSDLPIRGESVELASGGRCMPTAPPSRTGRHDRIGVGRLLADGERRARYLGTSRRGLGSVRRFRFASMPAYDFDGGAAAKGRCCYGRRRSPPSKEIAIQTAGIEHQRGRPDHLEPVLPLIPTTRAATPWSSSATTPSGDDWQNVQTYVSNYMANAATNISNRLASTLATPPASTPGRVIGGAGIIVWRWQ